jgi:PAS domain S-box-containing protein
MHRQGELNQAQRPAKDGRWHWKPKTDTVIWSEELYREELYRIAGWDPHPSPVNYANSHTLCASDSWERLQFAIEEALANGTRYSIELELTRPTGEKLWVIASGEAQRDPQGAVVGLIGTLQDITERKQIEQSTILLAGIVESSDDAIISKTLDGIITSWNKGAERIFGYLAKEAIGQYVTLIIPPERQAEESDILDRLRRGQRVDHFHTVRRRKDGTLLDVSLTISPLRDPSGRVVGASKVVREISPSEQQAFLGGLSQKAS